MAPRSYQQICSVSKALDLVGERWTLLIVRDLLAGPLGYTDLLDGLPGLTTNLLAKRLKSLAAAGLIESLPSPAGSKLKSLYSLTPAGAALAPVITELSRWGRSHGACPQAHDSVNFRWFLLLLRRQYVQHGGRWIVQLSDTEQSLQLRLGGPEFEAVVGSALRADLSIDAEAQVFAALLSADQSPDELVESGQIKLRGSSPDLDLQCLWKDFLASFQLQSGSRSDLGPDHGSDSVD